MASPEGSQFGGELVSFFSRGIQNARRRRRIKAARAIATPLREFVYLDEVSVYSLLTSRQGALAAEYTDTTTTGLKNERAGKLIGQAGVAKGELSAKREHSQTQSSQVLRKSTVQAAFKELYQGEEDRLRVKPVLQGAKPPNLASWQQLFGRVNDSSCEGWIADSGDLLRGQLVELEVELETHSIFKMTSVMSTLWGIINDNPELFPHGSFPELQNVAAVNRLLDKLLVGLIPIRCRVADYGVVELDGKRVIVHHDLAALLPADPGYALRPLYLVGVTEERLYWKDVRRILFSGQRFRVLARLNNDGVGETWVPVKLVDVLRDVVPDLAVRVEETGRMFGQKSAGASEDERRATLAKSALIAYAHFLGEHCGVSIESEAVAVFQLLAEGHCLGFESYDARKRAFAAVEEAFSAMYSVEVDRLVAAQLRSVAMTDSLLTLDGRVSVPPQALEEPDPIDELVLDAELVAIYW
ncbi:hypothetical protein ACGF5C_10870 [Micromonospora sp. NPDC047620]|uniref:DUF6414 family protein n=1 Tax=Micromonospora sp. NPDC047620 TaxID=3364251 RepID=UPI00371C7C6A